MRKNLLAVLGFTAIVIGTLPYGLALLGQVELPSAVSLILNFLGWMFVGVILFIHRKMLTAVEITTEAMQLPVVEGGLEKKLEVFLRESRRYHKAAYAFSADRTLSSSDLGVNLRRILELTFRELDAQAVQLSLFDEESGLFSQSMSLGFPTALASNELLSPDSSEDLYAPGTYNLQHQVLRQPVTFAGTMFATLWVELPPGRQANESDKKVLKLLATQGAIMLVDSRFTDELLRMRKAGEESVRAKTGFLANLSHEIRGPLGIILNGVELIYDNLCGPITDSQREILGMIKKNGEHLIELVNDVLDYAKVEAGKVTAKPVSIAVKPLLDDLASVIRTQALEKNHKLNVESVEEQFAVVCDKRHIRQMMINMLTNAVKYTPDGGEITLSVTRGKGNALKLIVKDSGIGIPKSEQSKVFSAFERVEHSYALAQVGTGLGMPLTKRLAEVNGGTADFISEEGKGSTFWVSLPGKTLQSGEKGAALQDEKKEKSSPSGQGEVVLLVDHEAEPREMLSRYLEHQGFQIITAGSGADVIKILKERKVQLAVVENELPDASGEEMVNVIRSNSDSANVPIILLSARAFVFDIERYLKLGVDRCLAKPVELSEVAVTARRLIDETNSTPATNN